MRDIKDIKADDLDTEWLTKNTCLTRNKNSLTVMRYYTLYGNSRAFAISATRMITDWSQTKAVIKECKDAIVDHRKTATPLHGMTKYV